MSPAERRELLVFGGLASVAAALLFGNRAGKAGPPGPIGPPGPTGPPAPAPHPPPVKPPIIQPPPVKPPPAPPPRPVHKPAPKPAPPIYYVVRGFKREVLYRSTSQAAAIANAIRRRIATLTVWREQAGRAAVLVYQVPRNIVPAPPKPAGVTHGGQDVGFTR